MQQSRAPDDCNGPAVANLRRIGALLGAVMWRRILAAAVAFGGTSGRMPRASTAVAISFFILVLLPGTSVLAAASLGAMGDKQHAQMQQGHQHTHRT